MQHDLGSARRLPEQQDDGFLPESRRSEPSGPVSRVAPKQLLVWQLDGSLAPAREAFRRLYARLCALPAAAVLEPRMRVAAAFADAVELSELVARPTVLARLATIGLTPSVLDELAQASQALHYVETCVRSARGLAPCGASALDQAANLRQELLGSCHWNLRGPEHAEALARITDSEDPAELALDLNELALLVLENLELFQADTTLDAQRVAHSARATAHGLSELPLLEGAVKYEWLDLRARAYTHLTMLIDELRTAGRYAFRGTPGARVWFAASPPVRRRVVSLGGWVRGAS